MPRTSRWGWIYATEEQKNWFEIFKACINQQDSDTYAAYEDPNLILRGGGVVALDTGTDTLSWSEDFEVLSMLTGGVITIEAGSLAGFEAGKIAYLTVSRPIGGNVTLTLSVTDNLGTDTSKLFIAMRRGDAVYFRSHADRQAMTFINKMDANKVTTPVATSGGGTATGYIDVGAIEGAIWITRVTALGNTTDSSIQYFADSGMTNELYDAPNKDCYTSPHEDRIPWYLAADSLQRIYYKITNNGGTDSAYELEMAGMGRIAS